MRCISRDSGRDLAPHDAVSQMSVKSSTPPRRRELRESTERTTDRQLPTFGLSGRMPAESLCKAFHNAQHLRLRTWCESDRPKRREVRGSRTVVRAAWASWAAFAARAAQKRGPAHRQALTCSGGRMRIENASPSVAWRRFCQIGKHIFLQKFLRRTVGGQRLLQSARSSLSRRLSARLGLPRVARVSKRTLAS
jgi:hypothetical protein